MYVGIRALYHIGLFANMPLYIAGVFDGNAMGVEMLVVGCLVVALWIGMAKRVEVKRMATVPVR